jgi:hypothetical protein
MCGVDEDLETVVARGPMAHSIREIPGMVPILVLVPGAYYAKKAKRWTFLG